MGRKVFSLEYELIQAAKGEIMKIITWNSTYGFPGIDLNEKFVQRIGSPIFFAKFMKVVVGIF
ncbi:hypothetical protein ASE92_03410 [Pedobacter sp. Leaf41]|jgi:hypothetical protein|nr:hypothetical protein ASE92_03410 [Pedobacter sp. Leaf41]